MNLRELTTESQTWCHHGESNAEVYVKVLDAYYKVSDIRRFQSDCNDKSVFIINTEVK